MTSASGRTPTIAEPTRRAGLRIWMLVALVAVVGLQMGIQRRWVTFRIMKTRHEAVASEYAWLAAVSATTAERSARSAELAETMAENLGPLVGAEQRKLAEGDREHERKERERARSYRQASDEASRLAEEFRNRW